MFGTKVNQSSAQATGASASGLGRFAPVNNVYFGKRPIDFSNPLELAALALIAASGVIAWKRFK